MRRCRAGFDNQLARSFAVNLGRHVFIVGAALGGLLAIGVLVTPGWGVLVVLTSIPKFAAMMLPGILLSTALASIAARLPVALRRPAIVAAATVLSYVSIAVIQTTFDSSTAPSGGKPNYFSLTYFFTFVPTLCGFLFGLLARVDQGMRSGIAR